MTAPRYRWRPTEYSALELVALSLFFVAGSVLGLAFAIVYIGMAALSFLSVHAHLVWLGYVY